MTQHLYKILRLVFPFILLTSCLHHTNDELQQAPKNLKHVVVKLADSLGSIAIDLPIRYDTFFTWTNYSDCGASCNKIEHRYQPKSLPITRESGFIWLGEPKDSVDRFTIKHSAYYYPYQGELDSVHMWRYHQNKKEKLISDLTILKIKSDTLEKINGHYFSIIVGDDYDSSNHQYSKKLLAGACIRANDVSFEYELLTKQKDSINCNFLENAMESLKTIHIQSN